MRSNPIILPTTMPNHSTHLLHNYLAHIELNYLSPLLSYLSCLFEQRPMPSHNEQHHLRVWEHCKTLLVALHEAGHNIAPQHALNALIACMFHDTGLLIDIGEAHGQHSAKLCSDYLDASLITIKIDAPNRAAILTAIANHDNKQLREQPPAMDDLSLLVATADDLDAAGLYGAYRYIEIYHHRGLKPDEIARRAAQNVADRQANWQRAYAPLHALVAHHNARFEATASLFAQHTQHPEVIAWICDNLVGATQPIEQAASQALTNPTLPAAVERYLGSLLSELSTTTDGTF